MSARVLPLVLILILSTCTAFCAQKRILSCVHLSVGVDVNMMTAPVTLQTSWSLAHISNNDLN